MTSDDAIESLDIDGVDMDQLSSDHTVQMARVQNQRIAYYFVGMCGLFLCAWPVTRELAGRETLVEVNIAVTLACTLAGTTAVATAWGRRQGATIKKLRQRNRRLVREVNRLKGTS